MFSVVWNDICEFIGETKHGLFGAEEDGGPDGDGGQWKKRQSMMFATDADSVSEDDCIDLVVPSVPENDKTQIRKLVVTSILHSEHAYVASLDILMQYMQTFKNVADTPHSVIPAECIDIIFCRIPELHRIHFNFIKELEPKVENWSPTQQIAEHFKLLALEEYPLAGEYLKNYQTAVDTVHKCWQENPQFKDLTADIKCKDSAEKPNLEELLHKPVVRFQRNTLVLHDLIACTPTSHADYDLLQKTLRIAQNFLENFQNPKDKDNPDLQRYLAKQGLIVERIANNQRKLRHVFLFNDVLVCAKQKMGGKQKIQFEIKWHIPLGDLSINDQSSPQEEKNGAQDIEGLQRKVNELQVELKQENNRARQAQEGQRQWSFRGHNNRLDKIKKKLVEQEAMLVLHSPNLLLQLRDRRTDKARTFLMSSDYERVNWRETIDALQIKAQPNVPFLSSDLQMMINTQKLPKLQAFGDDFGFEEELLFGSLNVTIHKLLGLQEVAETFCRIEVDSYNHFFTKARTNVCNTIEPVWNEDFEIDLEGAQTLRILCYKYLNGTDILVGKCALELSKAWLRGDFHEQTITLNKELSLTVSMRYISREQTLKRTPSAVKGGVFGVRVEKVTKREGGRIPLIVETCVKQIELRGIGDVGIYRISGLSAEIQRLKKAYEK
ncbi:hypothetical protein CAPTEDRAFT_194022, partial [Capitella teleta]